MIQITPQMRIVAAIEPADFRRGIDGLARLCKDVLKHDPFNGWVFVFRNRSATALKILVYDGQGFWLCHKRLSSGQVSLVAGRQECGDQDAGGPSDASASLGGQSRSHASRAGMAAGRAGGLTQPVASASESRRIALAFSSPCYAASQRNGMAIQRIKFLRCFAQGGRFRGRRLLVSSCPTKPTIIELDMDKLEEILRRVEAKDSTRRTTRRLKAVVESYVYLDGIGGRQKHDDRSAAEDALRREHREDRGGDRRQEGFADSAGGGCGRSSNGDSGRQRPIRFHNGKRIGNTAKRTRPQRGRCLHGRREDRGAARIAASRAIPARSATKGTVYETNRPGVLVRLMGQAPVRALVYYLQKLRCNLCGDGFHGPDARRRGREEVRRDGRQHDCPVEVRKRDAFQPERRSCKGAWAFPCQPRRSGTSSRPRPSVPSRSLKNCCGKRPKATWFTTMIPAVKILEMMGERARQAALAEERTDDRAEDSVEDAAEGPREDSEEGSTKKQKADRTGMFTTGIVSTREGHKIALFLSGRQHAGENLKDVLTRRAAELPPPIQMCDALARICLLN